MSEILYCDTPYYGVSCLTPYYGVSCDIPHIMEYPAIPHIMEYPAIPHIMEYPAIPHIMKYRSIVHISCRKSKKALEFAEYFLGSWQNVLFLIFFTLFFSPRPTWKVPATHFRVPRPTSWESLVNIICPQRQPHLTLIGSRFLPHVKNQGGGEHPRAKFSISRESDVRF